MKSNIIKIEVQLFQYLLIGIAILALVYSTSAQTKTQVKETTSNTLGRNAIPFDFDGDGISDLSVFRRGEDQWWIDKSSDGGSSVLNFPGFGAGKILVPADYTGDGKTDAAFFETSTGEWFVLRSEDNSYYSFPFGIDGDLPFSGNFDDDNLADFGVYRPTTRIFYLLKSQGGVEFIQFGDGQDIPVIEDYDGDGIDDIAVYRYTTGEWWINRSSLGLVVYKFGTPLGPRFVGGGFETPMPGDYDGDGKADVAYFKNNGQWFILRSDGSGFYSFPFGQRNDLPLTGDFDGDGIRDPAVFRPASATWFFLNSSDGFKAVTFGLPDYADIPLPIRIVD